MSCRKSWIAVTIVILSLVMFIPVAQAERKDVELTLCSVATYNPVEISPEIGISNYDQKGIMVSTHANKIFDNWTLHAVGVQKRVGGKFFWNGFSKEMGPDGEYVIWEWSGDSESGTTGKAIYGTGKWKGIKGEGIGKPITTMKPITPTIFSILHEDSEVD